MEIGCQGVSKLKQRLGTRRRERKEQENRKKIMRILKISTLHPIIYYGDRVSKCKMSDEYSLQSMVRKFEGNK
jgi:hypothetical protein